MEPGFRIRMAAIGAVLFLLGGCPLASLTGGTTSTGGSGLEGSALVAPGGVTDGSGREQPPQFSDCSIPDSAESIEAEVLFLVNRERSSRGLPAVVHSDILANQAALYACEMIHYGFFDHVDPHTGTNLADRAEQVGYDFLVIGENLAAGQQTATAAFDAWMESPGHRENILDERFTELGVAVRHGGDYGVYWVQEFGRPAEGNGL
ncbi:MAG: CAP domain-containing protein [Planctomycetes bacterium]|nr:CAP domain-containing protein [Planctomycetota bacterium]